MSTLERVPYRDLMKKPWRLGARGPEFFDCVGIAIEARKRYELEVVPGMFPEDYATEDDALALVRAHPGSWQRIGDGVFHATEIGDIVETLHHDGTHHVSTLIQNRSPKRFLTTSRPSGCIVVRALDLQPYCIGVYRWVR